MRVLTFSSTVFKLGVNPCVDIPEDVLKELLKQAGREKGPIPVKDRLNGREFTQTAIRFQGAWRLYLNMYMRQATVIEVGDQATVEIAFDPEPRVEPMEQSFAQALGKNSEAKAAFEKLTPSHRKEILRYLNSLKTEESLTRNIEKIFQYLSGEKRPCLSSLLRR